MKRALCLLFVLALSARAAITQTTVTMTKDTDFGDTVSAALKNHPGTVRIPAGSYPYKHTIVHPGAGHLLVCDAGATLTYTGTGDAISLAKGNFAPNQVAGIDGEGGCILQGSGPGSNQDGIHIYPSNHTFVRNMRIRGFGNGIDDTGGNSVEITNVSISLNKTGIYLTGSALATGFAANAVHITDSDISDNAGWGINSENAHCPCTKNLGNVISSNVFEGNKNGGVRLNWDKSALITGNYFEVDSPGVYLGETENVYGISVTHNYFGGRAAVAAIRIGFGALFNIEENLEDQAQGVPKNHTACFIDVVMGKFNGIAGVATRSRGVGTNLTQSNEWCDHGTPTTRP